MPETVVVCLSCGCLIEHDLYGYVPDEGVVVECRGGCGQVSLAVPDSPATVDIPVGFAMPSRIARGEGLSATEDLWISNCYVAFGFGPDEFSRLVGVYLSDPQNAIAGVSLEAWFESRYVVDEDGRRRIIESP